MPRPSSRPVSTRTQSRSVGKAKAKEREPLYLPEDEDERPRNRNKKKRSKEQNQKSSAGTREKFEDMEELEGVASQFIEDMENAENPQKSKKLVSTFQRDFAKTLDEIKNSDDLRVDAASASYYRAALSMVMDLIPVAEDSYRKTQKEGANYALQALVNQGRDLMNDVKLSEDLEGRLFTIKSLIQNTFERVAGLMMNHKYELQRSIDGITSNPSLRRAMRSEADKMAVMYSKGLEECKIFLNLQLSMYLSGDPNYLNPHAGNEDEDAPKKKKRKGKKRK